MHREVFRLKDEPMPALVDHRDRNGVNNQRSNLRAATNSEQSRNRAKQSNNTSGFIGVSWDKSRRHWQVQVKVNGKQKHLGYFDDPFSAAWFRDQFVKQLDPLAETNHLIDRRKGERRAA